MSTTSQNRRSTRSRSAPKVSVASASEPSNKPDLPDPQPYTQPHQQWRKTMRNHHHHPNNKTNQPTYLWEMCLLVEQDPVHLLVFAHNLSHARNRLYRSYNLAFHARNGGQEEEQIRNRMSILLDKKDYWVWDNEQYVKCADLKDAIGSGWLTRLKYSDPCLCFQPILM